MANKYTRLGKNIVVVFIGNAGAKLVGLLMLPFYTRWLSVEGYGTTDIINVYVSLLLGLATACIADAVFIFPKGQPVQQQKSYFSSGLCFALLSLGVTALLFKIATAIFAYKQIANSFTDNAWFIYGLLVTSFLQQYIQQFVRSIDRMNIYSTTGIVLTVSTAVFSFFIIPKWGVFGYVLALILANLLAAVYSFVFSGAFKYVAVKSIRRNICVEMLKYSVPLMPNSIMAWLIGALNRPLLEQYSGMHAVGILAVANKIPGILVMLFSVFIMSWQISLLEEFKKAGYTTFYNRVFRLVVVGMLFLFFIISCGSKLIIKFFTIGSFYESWKYIPLLTLSVIFSSIAIFVGSNFLAIRKSKYFFYSVIWSAMISVISNFILIPKFGIYGAVISVTISFAVMAVSRVLYSWKYVKIQNIKIYILMCLISVLASIIIVYVQTALLRWSLIIFLFFLFICINYELKKDISDLYRKLKNRGQVKTRK